MIRIGGARPSSIMVIAVGQASICGYLVASTKSAAPATRAVPAASGMPTIASLRSVTVPCDTRDARSLTDAMAKVVWELDTKKRSSKRLLKRSCHLLVPSSECIVRVLRVPSVAKRGIESAVELEMADCPIQPDERIGGYVRLSGSGIVIGYAARRSSLERYTDALKSAGLHARSIRVGPLLAIGSERAAVGSERGLIGPGSVAIGTFVDETYLLAVPSDKRPIFRTTPTLSGESGDGLSDEAEIVVDMLSDLASTCEVSQLIALDEHSASVAFIEELKQRATGVSVVHPVEADGTGSGPGSGAGTVSDPSAKGFLGLGAGSRLHSGAMNGSDSSALSAIAAMSSARSTLVAELRPALGMKLGRRTSTRDGLGRAFVDAAVLALWGLIMLAAAAAIDADRTLRQAKAYDEITNELCVEQEELEARLDDLRLRGSRVVRLQAALDSTSSAVALLESVLSLLPEGSCIDQVVIEDGRVTSLKGTTPLASSLIGQLERTNLFSSIRLNSPIRPSASVTSAEQFDISFSLKGEKGEALR